MNESAARRTVENELPELALEVSFHVEKLKARSIFRARVPRPRPRASGRPAPAVELDEDEIAEVAAAAAEILVGP